MQNGRDLKQRKRRGNSRYYLYFLVSLLACFGMIGGVFYAFRHLSIFELKSVSVHGNIAVPDSLILQKTQKYLGHNLFQISKKAMKQDLLSFSRVKDAKIRKHLMDKISIQIIERSGMLYVKSFEGNLYPIDEDGIVLSKYGKVYKEDLPIFSSYYPDASFKAGTRLEKADVLRICKLHKRIMKEAPEYLPIISEYFMIDNTIHIIDSRYGTCIIPSEDNLATQFKRYQFVQDNGNIGRRSTVDLRFENQVVVKAGEK